MFRNFLFFSFFIPIFCFSQGNDIIDYYTPSKITKSDSVAYSHDYIFKEGIYLKCKNFKQNNPITTKQIVIDYPDTQTDFMEQVFMKKKITYKDSLGKINKIATSEVWGYSTQNKIFKARGTSGHFYEMKIVGTLCYLNTPHNNYYKNENKTTFSGTNPVTGVTSESEPYDPLIKIKFKSNEECIYDIQTKQYLTLDPGEMKLFLQERDKELFDEFIALEPKMRIFSAILYLKKYNERHPLYLPVK